MKQEIVLSARNEPKRFKLALMFFIVLVNKKMVHYTNFGLCNYCCYIIIITIITKAITTTITIIQ